MFEVIALVSSGLIVGGIFTAAIIYYKKPKNKTKNEKEEFVLECINQIKERNVIVKNIGTKMDCLKTFSFTIGDVVVQVPRISKEATPGLGI